MVLLAVGDIFAVASTGLDYIVTSVTTTPPQCSLYRFTGGTAQITVIVPTTATDPASGGSVYDVVAISKDAFKNKTATFTTLQFAASTKCVTIGESAFEGCTLLVGSVSGTPTAIAIQGTTTTIGANAFKGTGIVGLTLAEGVTTIGNNAFQGIKVLVGALAIPKSVTSIGQYAFQEVGITSLTFTSAGTTLDIGRGAFNAIITFTVSGSITFPSQLVTIGQYAFLNTTNNFAGFTFASTSKCTSIGYGAFKGCTAITSIVIPPSLLTIDQQAFQGCTALTSTSLDSGSFAITSIGDGAFNGCTSLVGELFIPKTVTYIGAQAFLGTKVATLTLIATSTLVTIGDQAFYNVSTLANPTPFILPATMYSVGEEAFAGTGLAGNIPVPSTMQLLANGVYARPSVSGYFGSL